MKILKKIGNIITITICAIFGILVIMNIVNLVAKKVTNKEHPMVFGYTTAVVVSGSMSPTIEINDLVFVVAKETYEVNDVIMFKNSSNNYVTHRIVEQLDDEENQNVFVTKGDANDTNDLEKLYENDIVGIVSFTIPKIGAIISYFKTTGGIITLILIITTLGVGLYYLDVAKKEKQQDNKQDNSNNDNNKELKEESKNE